MTGTPKDRRPPTNAQMITWDELDKMTADNKYPPSARELKINLGALVGVCVLWVVVWDTRKQVLKPSSMII